MIRQPTPHAVAFAWHSAAIVGETEAFNEHPECGYFKRRLVKQGPFVPCRIYLHQVVDEAGDLLEDEAMLCEVNGESRDPLEEWNWLCGNPITKQRFDYMVALQAHARAHEPDLPDARPNQPIDWLNMPLPIFGKASA